MARDIRAILAHQDGSVGGRPKTSMKDFVVQKIATLIATGVLQLGDSLPSERELSAALSVSRETVRGALLILATRGIISVTHGARTIVLSDDLGELALSAARMRCLAAYSLEDVHEARLLVEGKVVREAARKIDADALDLLRSSIEAQEAAIADPVRFLICDREFHLAIYRAGGNAALADMAAELYSYQLEHRRRVVSDPGRIEASIEDHRAILSALEAQDPDAAVAAFASHETRIYDTTREIQGRSARP